jgi:hypothetical protein
MASSKNDVYLDLGWTSAQQFWTEVVLPDYADFNKSQTAKAAIHAVLSVSHLYYWILSEQLRGT